MPSSSPFKQKVVVFVVTYLAVFSFGFVLAKDFYEDPYVVTGGAVSELSEDSDFSGSANIVAVAEESGEGILGRVTVQLIPGSGNVLLNIRPFVEPDTQYSAQVAIIAAQYYTRTDISNKDAVIQFEISDEVGLVGGPSAGAATAVAVIAAIENRSINQSVALTGTVDEQGNIGHVGGILAKAKAASSVGVKLFLIPEGEMIVVEYEKVESESSIPFFKNVRYVPKLVNVQEHLNENNIPLTVKEVATIEEAAQYMII